MSDLSFPLGALLQAKVSGLFFPLGALLQVKVSDLFFPLGALLRDVHTLPAEGAI